MKGKLTGAEFWWPDSLRFRSPAPGNAKDIHMQSTGTHPFFNRQKISEERKNALFYTCLLGDVGTQNSR